ncbi:MAG: LysM peptidoglycan-binding domain-containing protein [Nitrospinae bacterium]|nr:LysM peptidoglycan-binding domain-containing protein [Nitrospinota bacterium]
MLRNRRCFLLFCVFAAGCSAAPVAENEIHPNKSANDTSIVTRAQSDPRKTVLLPISVPKPSKPIQFQANQKEPPKILASIRSKGNEANNVVKQPDPVESQDEKADKDSEPSPHDINLPVPETEEHFKSSPKPEAKKPKAFLYDVPVVRNAIVDRWIEYFTGPGRSSFSVWLGRGGRYIELFREILKEHQLPQDLAYLSLIESGFNPKARSRAGAVGPWQFMPGTARRMGLRINYYLDERRHPMKSTRAAAAYLSKLYEDFGDWHLALAAYNAGERRIARAIRRSKRKDYWSLARTRYLPNETRNYVAKYLAGMIIAKNPEVFGFVGIDYENSWNYKAIKLSHGTSLSAISRISKVSLRTLREINAELRTSVTPPGNGYHLFLPHEEAKIFSSKLVKLTEKYLASPNGYRIQPGDTFGAVAQRFGIPLNKLLEMNTHLHPRRLRVGVKILLPKAPNNLTSALQNSAPANGTAPMPKLHIVQKGENFWLIARKYNISTKKLVQLNSGIDPKRLRIGRQIRLPSPKSLTTTEKNIEQKQDKPLHHLVRTGENLWLIAKRYGISTKSLLAWNRLSASAKIYPGEKLIVRR